MNSISANLNVMIKASEKASKILIRDFGEIEKLQVSRKGPSDFVTNSDIKAEKIIIEELKKARPGYSIISEENGIEKNEDSNNTWIIDPIDGTINFLHGVPHFAISIALKSNNEIISGLIFDPIKNEMFFAEKENGAYFNNHRIRVSKKNKLDDCLFVTGGKIVLRTDGLILGDNIFFGENFSKHLERSIKRKKGATIFSYHVNNPEEFGVVEFDGDRVVNIEEKPIRPKSASISM